MSSKLLLITNLYPRPDEPQRGIYNFRLTEAMCELLCRENGGNACMRVVCLVPEWRLGRWRGIREWRLPASTALPAVSLAGIAGPRHEIAVTYLPVFYLPVIGRNLSWRFYTHGLKRCRGMFGENEMIIATWLYPDCVAAARIAAGLGKSVWFKAHGSDRFHLENPVRRRAVLGACNMARGIFCNCADMAIELMKAGIPENKLHVVEHGIDCMMFRRRPRHVVLEELGFPGRDERVILFVGHLAGVKGPDRAILALAALVRNSRARKECAVRLIMAGDGPMRSGLERMAAAEGIADKVTFLGDQAHDRIAALMNIADCLCLPSRSEGMPNVVLEALAVGLPVVATDVGGVSRYVKEQTNGIVVRHLGNENRITSELALALAAALDRQWNNDLISLNGRTRTWKRAAWEMIEKMTERPEA